MKIPTLSCFKSQNQISPQFPVTVTIKATTPKQAHLFRMINTHGKCQDIEIKIINRLAQQQIERDRRNQILLEMFMD
jgi:hypothetical protein